MQILGYDVRIFWAWYDCWAGVYWDRDSRHLFVCPVPMLVFEIWWEYSTAGRLRDRIARDAQDPGDGVVALRAALRAANDAYAPDEPVREGSDE